MLFERPRGGEKAVLVYIQFPADDAGEVQEFEELVASAGVFASSLVRGKRDTPDAKFFVGKGKADEIKQQVVETGAEVVIFDHSLTPAQERNLERHLECRVLDRTGLILDIFAQRAHTFEGKLQVELAQLNHLSTRLVRGWSHLERQKGGIGLRGPGETQLETDRRLIGTRIKQIKKRLEKVKQQRGLSRRARRKAELPTISLVGYTNAGKSTLFNRLTDSQVYSADKLFATLDPTIRRIEIGDAGPLIFVDTVGFISKLPHDLVSAFRATLEETLESDLLLHVIDASNQERDLRIVQVEQVLSEIGGEKIPRIQVFNKIDCIAGAKPHIDYDEAGKVNSCWLSAANGEGIEALISVLKDNFAKQIVHCKVLVPHRYGDVRARFYELKTVLSEQESTDSQAWILELRVQNQTLAQVLSKDIVLLEDRPNSDGFGEFSEVG